MKYISVLVLLVLLLVECCICCNKTISVEVTSSKTLLILPNVNQVILWTELDDNPSWNTSYGNTVNGRAYFINMTNTSNNWYTLTSGNTVYNVTIGFNDGAVSCRNITLDVMLSSRSFTCIPVSSCNNNDDMSMNVISWRKSYYTDTDTDDYDELIAGVYDNNSTPLNIIQGSSTSSILNITSTTVTNNRFIENSTLIFVDEHTNELLAGYYIAVNDMDQVLYQFTVYYGPVLINHLEEGSAIVTAGKDNFEDYYCSYSSFPNSQVTWTVTRDEYTVSLNNLPDFTVLNVTASSRNAMIPNMSIEYDYSWTLYGALIIHEVNYNHSGVINCTANNGYNTATAGRRLRVRSPLRPLWPVLGMIASFTVTAVFILGGYIVDKIRGENKETISQDEIDGQHTTHNIHEPLLEDNQCLGQYGAFRPLSVNSFNEDDETNDVYRRVSSTKELLPLEEQKQS